MKKIVTTTLIACMLMPLSLGCLLSRAAAEEPGAGKIVTVDNMERFLTAAGYTPKKAGETVYAFSVKQADWTFPIRVSLSPDHSRLWITTNLGTWRGDRRSDARKAELMQLNSTIAPSQFQFQAKTNQLRMAHPLDNRSMTTDYFCKELARLCTNVRTTAKTWKDGILPADASSFSGNWKTEFGALILKSDGQNVIGTYPYKDGHVTGTLSPDGRTLIGTWVQNDGKGGFTFRISKDSDDFTGRWWYTGHESNARDWNGKRTDPDE